MWMLQIKNQQQLETLKPFCNVYFPVDIQWWEEWDN